MNIRLTNQRILSIDAFRGITIFVMVFVNELAGVSGIPKWMKHMPADADAMSFVDVVFPAFLFIVGMAIPFAINSRLAKGESFLQIQSHIITRTIGLLLLGVFMVNAEEGGNEQAMHMSIYLWMLLSYAAIILIWNEYQYINRKWTLMLRGAGIMLLIYLGIIYRGENGIDRLQPHWWGILGLIGWAYLFTCIFYQLFRGNKLALIIIIGVCTAFYMIGQLPSVKESASLRWISYEAGNAAHTSIALCGTVLSLIFFQENKIRSIRWKFTEAFAFSTGLFVVGYLLRPYYKISKIYATPTWCLYCAIICVVIFGFLYWLIDLKKINGWTSFFKPAATNPLLTYIIPDIIFALQLFAGISLTPLFFHEGIPGILWSAFYAVIVMFIVRGLNRLNIKLHL